MTPASLSYAKRHLASLISRLVRRECFIITRNGVSAAALIPFEQGSPQERGEERAL